MSRFVALPADGAFYDDFMAGLDGGTADVLHAVLAAGSALDGVDAESAPEQPIELSAQPASE